MRRSVCLVAFAVLLAVPAGAASAAPPWWERPRLMFGQLEPYTADLAPAGGYTAVGRFRMDVVIGAQGETVAELYSLMIHDIGEGDWSLVEAIALGEDMDGDSVWNPQADRLVPTVPPKSDPVPTDRMGTPGSTTFDMERMLWSWMTTDTGTTPAVPQTSSIYVDRSAHWIVLNNAVPPLTTIEAGQPAVWFVLYRFSSIAPGDDYRPVVSSKFEQASNAGSLHEGWPLAMDEWIGQGLLLQGQGEEATIAPGETDRVVLDLLASPIGDDYALQRLTLEQTAGEPGHIGNLRLVDDRDGNGQPGEAEPVLASAPDGLQGEPVVLELAPPLLLVDGDERRLLLVADIGPAKHGMAYAIRAVSGELAWGAVGPLPLDSPPLTGMVPRDTRLLISSAGVAPGLVVPGAQGLTVAAVIVGAVDGDVAIDGLTVAGAGSIHEATDVLRVRLWHDRNASGTVDGTDTPGGDRLLATGVFLADDGELFLPTDLVFAGGGQTHLLLTVDLSAHVESGDTVAPSMVAADGATAPVTGLPLQLPPLVIGGNAPDDEMTGQPDAAGDLSDDPRIGGASDTAVPGEAGAIHPAGCQAGSDAAWWWLFALCMIGIGARVSARPERLQRT